MSGYIGTQPVPQATQTRDAFTATSGQTSFATSGYTPNFLDVFLNGVKLSAADYTASNGSDVVLATGAATGDILEVVAYTTFEISGVAGLTPSIDDNGNATAITIDSSENVQFGTTQTFPAYNNVVGCEVGGFGQISASRDSAEAMQLNRKTNDGDIALFKKDGTSVGSWRSRSGDRSTIILDPRSGGGGLSGGGAGLYPTDNAGTLSDGALTLGDPAARFKDLYLSGGIHLGGTGAANKLDDYEEGTFTPTFVNGTVGTNQSSGYYTKIGNTVYVNIHLVAINTSSLSGTYIGTLPFTPNQYTTVAVFPIQGFEQLGAMLCAQVATTGVIQLYYVNNSSGGNYNSVAASHLNEGANITLRVAGSYTTNS